MVVPDTARLIAGVDDAGRGPVIGPLVIAGVAFKDDRISHLRSLGVKDSKLLRPSTRSRLAKQIVDSAESFAYVEVAPNEIDEAVSRGIRLRRLNFLEAKAMAEVIMKLRPTVAYVDASDVVAERFGRQIAELLPKAISIVSEHHADAKYSIVGAASILAKVRRDQIIEQLSREYGDIGSGYTADPKTLKFLENWIRTRGDYPPIVRKSWKNLRRLEASISQKKLEA